MYSRLVFQERKIDVHRILEDDSLYSVLRSSGEDGAYLSFSLVSPSVHRQLSTGWLWNHSVNVKGYPISEDQVKLTCSIPCFRTLDGWYEYRVRRSDSRSRRLF